MSNNEISIFSDQSDLTEEQRCIVSASIKSEWCMPKFKAQHFVGNSQITPYGALKQYILELNAREHSLNTHEYNLEMMELDSDRLTNQLQFVEDEFDKRELDIKLRHKSRELLGAKEQVKRSKAERKVYLELIQELLDGEHGTLEDGTSLFDAIQDPVISEELERDYWIKRLGKQSAMDMIAYGRVGVGNIESITMLGKEDQRRTLSLASDVLVWNENRMQSILRESNERYQGVTQEISELAEQLKLTRE